MPASHCYPLYQAIYDHVNQVWPPFVTDALSASTIKEAVEIRRSRRRREEGVAAVSSHSQRFRSAKLIFC